VNGKPLHIGLVADFREEGWPSMDLVADMVEQYAPEVSDGAVTVTSLRAPFTRRLPLAADGGPRTVDRVVNRFWDYPRWLRRNLDGFDAYHVADHSYAHLVHVLPAERTVVFCHDADAFRAFFGERADGSLLPKRFTRRVLEGLRRAARVLCISEATRAALADHGLVDASRLSVVPLGVHPACSPKPDAEADAKVESLLGPPRGIEIVHVGSTIPRKRIDLLLKLLAAVAAERPDVRLLRVGGALTPAQQTLADELNLSSRIVQLPHLDRTTLAAVYRRALLALLTSEREGFGLPIVEALACGTPVVASDLDVCREVGGNAVSYCALDDVHAWRDAVLALASEMDSKDGRWAERRRAGLERARLYTWEAVARRCVDTYRQLAS
jgi:glycosyltransferase involved in cell wall biosynthesis